MMVIAAYDVSEDSRRSRLAALLQSVGDRVQKSVFVLSLAADELDVLRRKASAIIDTDEDSLYLFRQCSGCWEVIECVGQADPPRKVLHWAVM